MCAAVFFLTGCGTRFGRRTETIRDLVGAYWKSAEQLKTAMENESASRGDTGFSMMRPEYDGSPLESEDPCPDLPVFHSIEDAQAFLFSNVSDYESVSRFVLAYPLTYKGSPVDHTMVDSFANLIMLSDEFWKYLYLGCWKDDTVPLYNEDMSLSGFSVTINVLDVTFPEEMDTAIEGVRSIAETIRCQTSTDYEAALAAYDYITGNYTYCNEEFTYVNSLLGAVQNNCSKCFGFACLYDSLLEELGIESRIVIGQSGRNYRPMGPFARPSATPGEEENTFHAWNLVTMDGERYFCDTCADLGANAKHRPHFMCSVNASVYDHHHAYPEFWLTLDDLALSETNYCGRR